ncbi:bifunctional type I 3-dehydroquinate dehydratase/shikimate dehydrogenase [Salinispira pacifica]|uniref:shikimate dehydrogenase (NADP(+)) n=1 Tax=Salinispira pacifica TaxID=1307761 RepID=V5WEX4_9SPIO|nr:bifunctional type I 3-dehydroquinate dehydratase/shikimate dehydrogenase [Salinispira pacifica]AHC13721.1 Shikimate 5-dehydrogenase I alpha [Salinispira pacifica]
MSRICLTLPGPDAGADIRFAGDYQGCYQALELRLDLLENPVADALEILSFLGEQNSVMETLGNDPSLIMTLRRVEDGGRFSGSVQEQTERISAILESLQNTAGHTWSRIQPVLAVDLEADSALDQFAGSLGRKHVTVIRSLHDFQGTPHDLASLLEHCASQGDIPKLAVMPGGLHDLTRIFQEGRKYARRRPGKRFILLGMGEYGIPSRILPERIGSYLSFASPGEGVAPGQMDCRELHESFRARKINPDTPIFAIIGNPVSHSRSPEIHNGNFRRDRREALYIPLLCDDPEEIPAFALEANLLGASVTVPHKEAVRRILQHEDDEVSAVEACNTIIRDSRGWTGLNTDVSGFIQPIIPVLREIRESRGEVKAAVIGAGGAAKAAAYALLREGCELIILNRTPRRAEELAEQLSSIFPGKVISGVLGPDSRSLLQTYRYMIVQTTTVGMAHGHAGDPLSFYDFTGDEFLYDIIYTPAVTELMGRAENAGCRTKNGWEMFQRQAALQARRSPKLLTNM